jgi:hypothetical protein
MKKHLRNEPKLWRKNMDKYSEEEKKLMDEFLEKSHKYINIMEKASKKAGKDFKAFLFEGDWFLDFCRIFREDEEKGEDNAFWEDFGFIVSFEIWINDSLVWPCAPKKAKYNN